MKKNQKTISLVLLLLSFTLILADCSIFSFSDTNTITRCNTCPDISDHFEHSHSNGTEDNVIINEAKSKTTFILFLVDFISVIDINRKSNFISNIWQPPKFS
jgi:hypothetical protein